MRQKMPDSKAPDRNRFWEIRWVGVNISCGTASCGGPQSTELLCCLRDRKAVQTKAAVSKSSSACNGESALPPGASVIPQVPCPSMRISALCLAIAFVLSHESTAQTHCCGRPSIIVEHVLLRPRKRRLSTPFRPRALSGCFYRKKTLVQRCFLLQYCCVPSRPTHHVVLLVIHVAVV